MPAASSAGPVLAVLPNATSRIIGSAIATSPAETGITSQAMRSSAHRIDRANASRSPLAASRDISGRIAVCIGWASTAYGARKNTNATWYATTPPGDTVAPDDRRAQQHARARVQQHAPNREPSEPRQRGVAPVPTRAHGEAGPARGDHEDADVGDHTAGARGRQQQLLGGREIEPGVRSGQGAERHEARRSSRPCSPIGAAAVIENRRTRVEEPGRDRAERVQQHLREEEPQEERREIALFAPPRARSVRRSRGAGPATARSAMPDDGDEHPEPRARTRATRSRGARPPDRRPRRSASRRSVPAPPTTHPPPAARTARSTSSWPLGTCCRDTSFRERPRSRARGRNRPGVTPLSRRPSRLRRVRPIVASRASRRMRRERGRRIRAVAVVPDDAVGDHAERERRGDPPLIELEIVDRRNGLRQHAVIENRTRARRRARARCSGRCRRRRPRRRPPER